MKARRKGSTGPFKELHQIVIGRNEEEFEDLRIEDAEFEQDDQVTYKIVTDEIRHTLEYWGYDPNRKVSNMSLAELYSLMQFAINRNK